MCRAGCNHPSYRTMIFIPGDDPVLDSGPEGAAEDALRALASVIDRRVEQIDSRLERGTNGRGVPPIVRVVALAEVSAETDRGCEQLAGKGPKERTVEPSGMPSTKAVGAALVRARVLTV